MIDGKTAKYIADLAKVELTPQEVESISQEMEEVIGMMDKLADIDTEGVQPTNYLLPEHDPLREDEVRSSLDNSTALENAPDGDNGFFIVPKVIKS